MTLFLIEGPSPDSIAEKKARSTLSVQEEACVPFHVCYFGP